MAALRRDVCTPKLECATCLVVVAADEEVARWAAEPIGTLQVGSSFLPIVLGPSRIPVITSSAAAERLPELAVLSALAHGRGPGAADIGRAALLAAGHLDDERRALYTDLVLYALGSAVRSALEIEMNITDYEFKSDFFKRRIAEEVKKEVKKEGDRREGPRRVSRGARGPRGPRARCDGRGGPDLASRPAPDLPDAGSLDLSRAATAATARGSRPRFLDAAGRRAAASPDPHGSHGLRLRRPRQ